MLQVNLVGRIENARRRQGELLQRMVQLLRVLDALESRLATQMGLGLDRQALAHVSRQRPPPNCRQEWVAVLWVRCHACP